jgi:C4-dicarboxylate-specific signal transduction histidine kinase
MNGDDLREIDRRLRFHGLDLTAQVALRGTAAFLDAWLPEALDGLYDKVRAFPETRRLFTDEGHIRGAREAQLQHWRMLATARFDAAYVASAQAIGLAHARIGLDPRWYISGYSSVLAFLVRKNLEQVGAGEGPSLNAAQAEALVQAATMDMELVVSVYLQAAEDGAREARDELARAARVLSVGVLASSIAHEVNQPVAAIVANSDAAQRWLAHTPPNLERARLALERITRDAGRTSAIVGRARGMTTKAQSKRHRVDLNLVLREAVLFTETRLRRASVKVATEWIEGPVIVFADPVQIQQVAVNLITNAIDAMEHAPRTERLLTIACRASREGFVFVSVADTGSGVEPADAEHIFTQLFTTKPGGMGLGLSVSKAIVEAHGGSIAMDRNSPSGTVFTFSLPAAGASELPSRPSGVPGRHGQHDDQADDRGEHAVFHKRDAGFASHEATHKI